MRAFDEIVRCFRGFALRYAYTIVHDWELAHDAVQDSFVQAYTHLPGLREPSAFPVWLRTIVSRCCGRILSGKEPPTIDLDAAQDAPSQFPDPLDLAAQHELMDRIHTAIGALPDLERTVTQLFYMDGLSQKEIADSLGIPATTVNNRLHSSRTRLRLAMGDEMGRAPTSESRRGGRTSHKADKEAETMLQYSTTVRRLLKGDTTIVIKPMTEDDIPAMRRLDDEITAGLELANACRAPGNESSVGGPWAQTDELRRHFRKYQDSGNMIILAEDNSGKLIGFADLWATDEPEPFGRSLDVECIDFLWEYYSLGLETVLLQEAEKVAVLSRLPALDIGTNTSSGDYPSLRRFGMRLFYEYDKIRCNCGAAGPRATPAYRVLPPDGFDRTGLLRISHWCPTDFEFDHTPGRPGVYEIHANGERAVVDLWRLYDMSPDRPIDCEIYAPPSALTSSGLMTEILNAAAILASEAGATDIPLPCPPGIDLGGFLFPITKREFAYAWMRKGLPREP